jgi:hypothetical protein
MGEPQNWITNRSWELSREPQPLIRFNLDNGNTIGYPAWDFIGGCLEEQNHLFLHWPLGTISITGEQAPRFFEEFSTGRASNIKADGKNILSVTLEEHEETAEMRAAREESTGLRSQLYSQYFMKKAEDGLERVRERTREEDDDD